MKRFTCLLFSIIFIVLSLNISKAEEQIQEEYYNVNVEFSDTRGQLESIQIMLKNNNVYINAEQIGTRLGYKVSVNDEYVAIYNKEKSDNVPYSMTLFYFNSTSIKHMIFNKMVDYQAVCESIKNDEGNWIPLEQALFLMNSSYMIEDSYILIDKPEKNITDIYMDILKENQNYKFDFTKDIGISEDNLSKMEKVSFLVQQLNGLLKNDGASWLQAFNNFGLDNSVYDKKYTEQFAMLFCTYSDDEFKKEIKDVNDKMSLFNGNSVMSKTIKALNKQQTEKIDDLENELWKIISVNGSNTAKYNSTYKELEKLCKQDKSLKKITALYNSVQDELKNLTEPFDKVMALAEVIEYLEEFVNQDEFAIKVLSDFSSDTELSCNMSLAMKKELLNYSDTLKSNIINYSAKRYLSENYSKLISKGLNLSEALPGSATLMLIAWDIISDNVPYYKDGISQTDSFMLSVYSQIFMSEAFINYQKCRDSVFNSDGAITVSDLYRITEYCYTYLKSCYISRQSALGSLNKDTQNQIPDTIKYQEAINEEISGYLVKLKNAKMSNEELDYGFLPENNKKFLDEYDNGDIMTLIKKISTENNIFESLPERFIFTTGAGGWHTEINLKKDGTFTGQFIDYELMMKQVTISEFNGKFNDVKKIDEYTYSMRLEYLNLIKGEPYYQNGLQYIYDTSTCPYGLDNANDFMIYLPGISIANLPQDFINWTTGHISAKSLQKVLPDGYYGIYNVGGKEGFIGKFDY